VTAPRVSVVIPTRNGAATLPRWLDRIERQEVSGGLEIVAVDSGSTDGTLDLLSPKVTTLLRVALDDFNHGATRNLAIARARGTLVVLTVQDALPETDGFLAALTAPFADDPAVAGTVARQLPAEGASPLARHYLSLWPAAAEATWRSRLDGGDRELAALTPHERLHRAVFDNVASCLRRSTWERHPFRPTLIAEDLAWGLEVLLSGHTIHYVPQAVVRHSHDRPAAYELARTRLVHARLHALFGLETIPTAAHLMRAMAGSALLHARLTWRHPAHWARAAALAVVWPLGQYLGARDARAGRVWRPPGAIV
jgi:rhamnosyltransferase